MRLRSTLAVLLLTTACATTPDVPVAAERVDDGLSRLADIRLVRSRVIKGEQTKLQRELADRLVEADEEEARAVVFLQAVAQMPSDPAWQKFRQLATESKTDPWPFWGMAETYAAWKMYPQASGAWAEAELRAPGYLPIALGRAQLALAMGETANAKSGFEALLARNDLPEAHAGLGQIALAAGDRKTARQELLAAVRGDPTDVTSIRQLSAIAMTENDVELGYQALRELVAFEPNDAAALFDLARMEEQRGEIPSAVRHYQRSADLRGMDAAGARHIVELADRTDDKAAQRAAVEQLNRLDRDDPIPSLRLAKWAIDAGDLRAAEGHYRAALERQPTQMEAQLGLARLLKETNKRREAIELYRSVIAQPKAPPEASEELKPLIADLKLPAPPIAGTAEQVNQRYSAAVIRFYRERLRAKPKMKGKLLISLDVLPTGKVSNVAVGGDSFGDEPLELFAYFAMKDAEFPKQKRSLRLELELKP